VTTGDWTEVRDLQNTGLKLVGEAFPRRDDQLGFQQLFPDQKYVTSDEVKAFRTKADQDLIDQYKDWKSKVDFEDPQFKDYEGPEFISNEEYFKRYFPDDPAAQADFIRGGKDSPSMIPPESLGMKDWDTLMNEGVFSYDDVSFLNKVMPQRYLTAEDIAKAKARLEEPPLAEKSGGAIHMQAGGLSKLAKILKKDAPNIIIPSDISRVKEAVRQSKGDFGARRVERAADEIPNLDKLYKEEALKQAFTGDNAKALMTMNPKDFERYATPIPKSAEMPMQYRVNDLMRVKGGFDDVPFFLINKEEQGLPLIPFISGHEGRHRNRAMAKKGVEQGLVELLPRAELREPLPRRSQEEYIEALKKELEMTGNMVEPQIYQQSGTDSFLDNLNKTDSKVRRPAIKLPDIYAKGGIAMAPGGLIHMASGGSPTGGIPSMQDTLKNIQNYSVLKQGAPRKPNELGGVILSGASWMAGDEKTRLAKQLFGEDVTNTAIGGQKTSDVLNQLNAFERDGGTFQKGATVVLDIGANDIAQGVDKDTIRKNLNEIVSRLGDSGVNVILSGQPEAKSYEEAINSTTLQMDDLYNDIAAKHPNVTLVDAMSGMLNQKDLMDESGFHLNSDDAKLAYFSQFANAYKGTANQGEIGIPKQVTQTDNVVDIPQEIAQITQTSVPETSYTPEVTYTPEVISMPAVVEAERQPSAGYTYAQNNSSIDNYYNVINDYLAQERTQDEIQAAMEQYGVSQADVDAARGFGAGKVDDSYATAQYKRGGITRMASGGLIKNLLKMTPKEEALAKLPQMKAELAAKQALEAEYKKAMREIPYDQQITLKEWEATRLPPASEANNVVNPTIPKAKGGLTKLRKQYA
jgi:hypothetical protein